MKSSTLTTLAAILIVGAGGFFAGRISSSDGSASTSENSAAGGPRSRSVGATSGSRVSAVSASRSSRGERNKKASNSESSADRLVRLESIVRSENALDRSRALLDFIDHLGPGDFEDAIASFRSLGITRERIGEYSMLLSAWAQTDPMAALEFAKANTGSPFAANTILSTWVSADPEAAIGWAKTHHEGEGANPYMAGIIRGIAATDPTRATQLLTEMPRSVERGQALDAVLPELLRQGADATKTWIANLSDDSLRNGAMSRAVDRLAQIDPAGTAAWLLSESGDARQESLDNVYSAWVQKDKQQALSSLAALPTGQDRANALLGAIRNVAVENPSEAISLMNRYPNEVTDKVVRNYVWHSFGTDPSAAIGQIARMTDEKDRDKTYARTIGAWMERDPAAAASWMQTNPMPDSVLKRIESEQGRKR